MFILVTIKCFGEFSINCDNFVIFTESFYGGVIRYCGTLYEYCITLPGKETSVYL